VCDAGSIAKPDGYVLSTRALARRSAACLAVLCGSLLLGSRPASGATPYVDGVSDQSLPYWDHSFTRAPFASYFDSTWVAPPAGRIRLARYVVQYDVLALESEHPHREAFRAWLQDVRDMGLTPEIAPTVFTGVRPSSVEYRTQLERVLAFADGIDHVAYVEPWNEPNNQGGFRQTGEAIGPAHYADAAHSVCESFGCAVIAGNFEDTPGVAEYAARYAEGLTWRPALWGVHPYGAVKSHDAANLEGLKRALEQEGLPAAELWFTEVAADYCIHGEVRGETQQAGDVSYLLDVLIPAFRPAHVFYYGFMNRDDEPVPCSKEPDTELYDPDGAPRRAAAVLAEAPQLTALSLDPL